MQKKRASFCSEAEMVKALQRLFPSPPQTIGIGDDAAVLPQRPFQKRERQVVTKDLFVEGVHFKKSWFTLSQLAWKCTTLALTDLLAMGAHPQYLFLGIGSPADFSSELFPFLRALQKVLAFYHLALLGGDFVQSPTLFFSLTLLGRLRGEPLLRQRGAPGDLLVLTLPVGSARLGLLALKRGEKKDGRVFLQPKISVPQTLRFVQAIHPKGAIDLSDGLASDLQRLLYPGLGVRLQSDLKWVAKAVRKKYSKLAAARLALQSGEEPSLALLVEPHRKVFGGYLLGEVVSKKGIFLEGKKLAVRGFDHFTSLRRTN